MIAWVALKCAYLLIGGLLAPGLMSRVLIQDRAGEALGNPVLALIAALGVLMLCRRCYCCCSTKER